MALSNSTGLVSEAGGDTEDVVAWFWLSLLVRGRDSLLGGSRGPAGVEEDGGSDEAALTSVVWAGPASILAAEALPEVVVTAEVVRLFPCVPGDTWTDFRQKEKFSWMVGCELIQVIEPRW